MNPDAHQIVQIKITPQLDSAVDEISVAAQWAVSNHACAPLQRFSGASIEKVVEVPGEVRQVGSSFVATMETDHFQPDNCHWVLTGYAARLIQKGSLVGVFGTGHVELTKKGGRIDLICVPPPVGPVCLNRYAGANEKLKDRYPSAYTIVVESVK